MKRILAVLVILMLILTVFAACGRRQGNMVGTDSFPNLPNASSKVNGTGSGTSSITSSDIENMWGDTSIDMGGGTTSTGSTASGTSSIGSASSGTSSNTSSSVTSSSGNSGGTSSGSNSGSTSSSSKPGNTSSATSSYDRYNSSNQGFEPYYPLK